MPFAPSIREESASRYFDNPKNICAEHMAVAFKIKDKHQQDLSAATHPRDNSIRPQVVRKDVNPTYHKTISLFEQKTGRGGFLNTSFNLHGEPIVYSPADAISVLQRSGLKHLVLNNFLISKH